jgi:hypothetical protein
MSQILCRLDANQGAAVVFNVDSWTKDSQTIKAWTQGSNELIDVPMTYYYGTVALSANDEKVMAERYAVAMNDANAQIRHRLPRTEKHRPDLFKRPKVTENSVVLPSVQAANAATLAAPTLPAVTPTVSMLTPPKNTGKAKGKPGPKRGSGRAKSIESQALPTATPDMVAQALAAAEAHFLAQVAEIRKAAGLVPA